MTARLRRAAGLVFAGLLIASAAPAEEYVDYRVQPGDTLYAVAARYLEAGSDWRLLARINKVVDPKRLAPGSTLRLPASRLLAAVQAATVLHVQGSALVRSEAGGAARPLATGEMLAEGMLVQVAPSGFVSLRLADGSVLQLQGSTRIALERLREARELQRRQNVIRLDEGRVDSRVVPQPRGSRFDVRTPLAVTGVRGTRFGVSVAGDGTRVLSDVVEGKVAVAGHGAPQTAEVAAGQGAIVGAATRVPAVRTLLPAPQLSLSAGPLDRLPLALPIVPVEGAAAYRLEVAEDEGFTRIRQHEPAATMPLQLAAIPDGAYFLGVRAIDADGLVGRETVLPIRVKTTPIPPLARAPEPGRVFAPGRIELKCTEVPGGTAYLLQLARDGRFDAPLAQQSQPGRCSFDVEVAAPGDYRWRVATVAKGADGSEDRGPFGDPSNFLVMTAPVAPEPAVDAADGFSVHWAGAPGLRYQVQLAADERFTQVVRDIEVDQPRVRFDLPAGCSDYYVRLRALGMHGLSSPFSPARRLSPPPSICTSDGTPLRVQDGSLLGRQAP